jgi:hypothetical protein
MINYSAAYLSEIERGKRPTAQVAQRCDEALGGTGALTALAHDTVVRHDRPVPHGGAGRALIKEFSMTADESARFIRRAAGVANEELVDQLADEVRTLAARYLCDSPDVVFARVAELRREVLDMLDGHLRATLAIDLYLLAGQLTALLAHASADLAQPQAAESHARTAWICADLAGHNPLRAYVRWIQSHVAHWSGNHVKAALIAHDGRRYATQGSNLLRLASQEARAWAACADGPAVAEALRIAATAREAGSHHDEVGVFWFNPGKAAYYACEARLALGGAENVGLARTDAEEAEALLTGEERPSVELVAAARLDLIAAHLAGGGLDAAVAMLPAVLDLPPQRRTVPLVERCAKVARTLAQTPFAGSPAAADARARIAHFVAHPATHEPLEQGG